ncbi:hypothetical protein [Sneathiella litorea]|uniref:Hook-length control protein FliK n=1 Tax=Sneathiella litorea TaxID=2606216 RepID=A0A6L8W6R8_9PROT|nr:hypothetical protein [Sneathiella litorea]MZR30192.1 hypothetical protein [Sneathiella litorea]
MSGIRSPSGVPSGLTGTANSPASGQGPITPAAPATAPGNESSLPTNTPRPKPAATISENTPINAVVMAKSTNENVVLHTEFGNFRMTTPTPLPLGSHIVFEVIELQEVILARLLSMNGKDISPPLDIRLLPTVEKTASGAEGYLKAGQLHPLELKAGMQALASLLPGVKAEAMLPKIPAPLSAMMPDLRVASSSGSVATIQDGRSLGMNQQGLAAYQRYHNPSAPASSSPYGTSISSSGNQFHVVEADILRLSALAKGDASKGSGSLVDGAKINLIIRPQQMDGLLSSRPGLFQGTVIAASTELATNGSSRVTLQTPLGTLSFNSSTPLATGTTVQFALANNIGAFPLPNAEAQQAGGRLPAIGAMGDWQNLREALNLVAHHDPIIAQTVISQIMPQANAQLSNTLLFFMAALNLGSIEKWLGQDFTLALKAAGRNSLLNALEDDFATFSRLQSEPGGQDWKALNFPFFDGTNLRQVRMFLRNHKNPNNTDNEKDTTRFIIELNLTKNGQIQLDGLFKRHLFDLAIRSHQAIPEEMRLHIGKLFNEHMEISGLKGQLIFKTVPSFPIDPLAEWESCPMSGANT